MKANRLSKDESGADSSDAIIILALILGLLLVLVYMGRNVGNISTTISDWAGGVGEWAGDVAEGVGSWFGSSSTIEISADEENTLKEMYIYDVFIITANNTQTNYKATLSYEGDTYRGYDLSALGNATSTTSYLFGEAGERLFGRVELKTFTISNEAMERLEKIREGQTLTLQGDTYSMKITAQGRDVGVDAKYTIEIRNESATENT